MVFKLEEYLQRARSGELLNQLVINVLCLKVKEMLINQENVTRVAAPVTLVGDVHGQFYDLRELFKVGGEVPNTNYLFLGDYVDRGAFSIETICYLLLLKLKYPKRVTLIRGNHETRQITQVYGFYTQCQRKYGSLNVWKYITDVFDYLPISAIVENQYFCVHAGLSPTIQKIDDIKKIIRSIEIPHEGPYADLVWSDPDPDLEGFAMSSRGAGYLFGGDIVKKFNHINGMKKIIRAHQLCMEGFLILFEGSFSTVWSAPNYCYRFKNQASILQIDEYANEFYNVFAEAPENERKRQDANVFGGADSDEASKYFL